jgi:hypothetical protein
MKGKPVRGVETSPPPFNGAARSWLELWTIGATEREGLDSWGGGWSGSERSEDGGREWWMDRQGAGANPPRPRDVRPGR